ncbi:hypothetical protein HYH02_001681 [Chlamydomonas schloesseri]|uniref:Oxidized purine nucleoside triphosphate hydrolase n=1 Tax=Chlamydomonas schloesseri TaxID=2026947 RepID=A0A835WTI8_9CHLO|nr:hypothetical protein HYH02_001681 [Chlamydomonas schloesseri]|eukprot:KAG2453460.1 hypothetical protein HYH02_001681 [Chlamydomonas schloesseri]
MCAALSLRAPWVGRVLQRHAAAAPAFVRANLEGPQTNKLLTLVIINDGARVLLGRKKRGFGEGYYNGFGGKVEAGETVWQAAERELLEEACITAEDMKEAGVLVFTFDDNPQPWEVHVFSATKYRGEPTETDEMAPVWFNHAEVPFDKMWADDVHWYPAFLQHKYFRGVFGFRETTKLTWHVLEEGEE